MGCFDGVEAAPGTRNFRELAVSAGFRCAGVLCARKRSAAMRHAMATPSSSSSSRPKSCSGDMPNSLESTEGGSGKESRERSQKLDEARQLMAASAEGAGCKLLCVALSWSESMRLFNCWVKVGPLAPNIFRSRSSSARTQGTGMCLKSLT